MTGRAMEEAMVGSSTSSNHMLEVSRDIKVGVMLVLLEVGSSSISISNNSSMDSTTRKSSWQRSLGQGY